MATYAIGDLQGCLEPFEALLAEIGFSPGRDRLWLTGDLVNRGPDSLGVLRRVRGLGASAVTVLGNHDLHLLMVAAGHGRLHAEDTLGAVLDAPDRDDLLDWLRRRPLLHVEPPYFMVHAGLLPAWSVAQAQELAQEVGETLAGKHCASLLEHMYGNLPDRWDDALCGWERQRVIINAMTRMRVCTADGRMALAFKGPPGNAPAGYLPWFVVPGRASAGDTAICGHWSALGFLMTPGLIALDSGCLWGGCLTAVRLEDGRVFRRRCPRSVAPEGWG
ncbi:MAG: Bis(5'-nucleosyl)-tetraphosphatase [symmetrical] [Rhodocyclaceae bacterium]|nr:Bis(5'-nucleosyl)-tetraphosphatase [symmetrical] [Rhodocyclaceae bacterium]